MARRRWDLSTIFDLPKAKSRIQALSPRNLRKNSSYFFFALLCFCWRQVTKPKLLVCNILKGKQHQRIAFNFTVAFVRVETLHNVF